MNAASIVDSSWSVTGAPVTKSRNRVGTYVVWLRLLFRVETSCVMYVSAAACVTQPWRTALGKFQTTPVVVLSAPIATLSEELGISPEVLLRAAQSPMNC